MAAWYVRRGEKVAGPITVEKLKAGLAEGKLQPTDEIAKDPSGPWTAVRKTSLLKSAQPVPAVIQQTTPEDPTPPPPPTPTSPGRMAAAAKGFGAILEARAQRKEAAAQRKHELRIEQLRTKAAQAASKPVVNAAPSSPQKSSPPPTHQTTVIVQQSSGAQGLAALINFLFPPFGYLIQGRLMAFFGFWFLFVVVFVAGLVTGGIGWIGFPVIWIVSIVDAANYRPKR